MNQAHAPVMHDEVIAALAIKPKGRYVDGTYGRGGHARSVVYGVDAQDRDTFAKVMHENFTTLFPSEDVTAEEMMASIEEVMKSDATLSKYVA